MGKAIILVNERANSFGETNIMALMAYCKNSILIGSNTSGSNGNVAICNLIGDIEIGFTGIDFRFPNDVSTQRTGISPNIFVNQSLSDFSLGKDTVLDFAIQFINEKE
ncbi:MAG: hypothetical protein IPO04_06735 [Cytophagaceae bacterium]|nr:hypothetical protein [Cytophagaceae bacterium]